MYTILLIEDDKNIRESLMAAGEAAGVRTVPVEDKLIARGQADEACNGNKYDAIIVGGYFHEAFIQNGHQIVERIRIRNRRVIVVGTAGDPRREQPFLDAGANAFVVRGSGNRPASGLLTALELLKQRDEKKKKPVEKEPKPTPDQT